MDRAPFIIRMEVSTKESGRKTSRMVMVSLLSKMVPVTKDLLKTIAWSIELCKVLPLFNLNKPLMSEEALGTIRKAKRLVGHQN